MPFVTALQNTENARVAGESKVLILVSTVKYEIFAAVFIFALCIFFAISKTDPAKFIYIAFAQ